MPSLNVSATDERLMVSEAIGITPESSISRWDDENIPDLSGNVAIVTGANSGLGFEVTKALAAKGALVVMGCRNVDKGEEAKSLITKDVVGASLDLMLLDLADLSSVKSFAAGFREKYKSLHILCNNAGVMQVPKGQTVDGFETHFGINHLGHFALTGLLLDLLLDTGGSRVVTVSSGAHRWGKIDFDDIGLEKNYGRTSAYGRSKLANLLFAYELQRRLDRIGSSTISVAAHPGYAATNLQRTGPRMGGGRFFAWLYGVLNILVAQSARMGALPILYAATAGDVKGGNYIGPAGFGQMRGYPKKVESNEASHDEETAKRLWDLSMKLTKVKYASLDR
jgi:NAD(P)-dependent dehydrogenase (short-subunit alcohol dehydrogenase family)